MCNVTSVGGGGKEQREWDFTHRAWPPCKIASVGGVGWGGEVTTAIPRSGGGGGKALPWRGATVACIPHHAKPSRAISTHASERTKGWVALRRFGVEVTDMEAWHHGMLLPSPASPTLHGLGCHCRPCHGAGWLPCRLLPPKVTWNGGGMVVAKSWPFSCRNGGLAVRGTCNGPNGPASAKIFNLKRPPPLKNGFLPPPLPALPSLKRLLFLLFPKCLSHHLKALPPQLQLLQGV